MRILIKGIRYLRLLGLRLLIHAVMEKLRGRSLFFYNEERIMQDCKKFAAPKSSSIHEIKSLSPEDYKVSIIIPSDNLENITQCIENLIKNTTYSNYEIILVTNSEVTRQLEDHRGLRVKPAMTKLQICLYDKPFNFSDKCNEGAQIATGNVLCFYNDDIRPIDSNWIESMLQALTLPDVGAVTPLQMSDSKIILSAGFALSTPGLQTFAFHGARYTPPRHLKPNQFIVRDVSALSGACFLIKKDIFTTIGMFNTEDTPNSFSDTEISLKIRSNGYRLVIAPDTRLIHENKITWRKTDKPDKAFQYMMEKWGKYLSEDIFFTDKLKTLYKIAPPPHIYKYYAPINMFPRNPGGRDVLFVSHELSLSGAPLVLMDMVKIVMENGDWPVVISLIDGPLRQEYLDMGVTVIIDNSICDMTEAGAFAFDYVARNFDLVVVNTLACWRVIEVLSNSLPPILWWLHESPFAINLFKSHLPNSLAKNTKTYAVSEYSANSLKNLGITYDLEKLPYGISDNASVTGHELSQENATFLIIAPFEHRKAQDIFVKALEYVDKKTLERANFVMIGSIKDLEIHSICLQAKETFNNIAIYDRLPREKVLEWYKKADCLIIPSREDPLPVVANEAMMFSKPVICSNETGTADYINHNKNGLIFPSEDCEALAEYITFAISNRDKMAEMGCKARKEIYEKHFTMERFRENVLQAINLTKKSTQWYNIQS